MNPELAFDSIESAHEFVALVSKVALETKCDIDADIQRGMSPTASRRVEALQIVANKLGTLELHLTQTRRILNDLRSLHRLLFGERSTVIAVVPLESTGMAKPETAAGPSSKRSRSGDGPENAVAAQASPRATARKRAVSSSRDPHPNVVAADAWYIRPEFKSESKASQTGVLCDTKRG